MRYCIYFTWKDGTRDSINVDSAKERNLNIKDMLDRDEFSHISYCPIYNSGEYGMEKVVLEPKKTYFVIADVHSFYDEMIEALNEAGFDKKNPDHVFVHCGDLLDRGPDAVKCLEYVNSLERKILIKGNHEDLLEDILFHKKWFDAYDFHNGTVDTISQLSGITLGKEINGYVIFAMIQECSRNEALKEYLKSVINYAEIGDYIIVHGWIPLEHVWGGTYKVPENWKEGDWNEARWFNGMKMWKRGCTLEGKTIVCGHWSTRWGHERYSNTISNDTFERDGIIALDATTVLSKKVNVFVFEA